MDRTTKVASMHFELIQGPILNGTCPTNDELAGKMEISSEKVEELLGLLELFRIVMRGTSQRRGKNWHPGLGFNSGEFSLLMSLSAKSPSIKSSRLLMLPTFVDRIAPLSLFDSEERKLGQTLFFATRIRHKSHAPIDCL
jgi:hypothetical protein